MTPAQQALKSEYLDNEAKRRDAISRNRSFRVRGLPLVPVPAKMNPPRRPVAYAGDGTYEGYMSSDDQAEEYRAKGYIIRMETF
jgi:hypothetical protein